MVKTLKTRDMSALKEKLKKQAGFTLAELLIVIAIIAVLAAIAVPVYLSQMTAAQRRVDEATLASATTMAASDYLLNNRSGSVSYGVAQSDVETDMGNRNIAVYTLPASPAIDDPTPMPDTFKVYVYQSDYNKMTITIGEGGVIEVSKIEKTTSGG